jgi:hypothetical protein
LNNEIAEDWNDHLLIPEVSDGQAGCSPGENCAELEELLDDVI